MAVNRRAKRAGGARHVRVARYAFATPGAATAYWPFSSGRTGGSASQAQVADASDESDSSASSQEIFVLPELGFCRS